MVSLLLVLSVFVSSGVLWELRDTVITMVNEPLCGLEEHEHTDECYEYRLVCGLEENEEHTHTDECWEKVLVCGDDEHLHTMLCYDENEEMFEISNDPESEFDDEYYAISNVPSRKVYDQAEEDIFTDLPMLALDNEIRPLDNDTGERRIEDSDNPTPIQTIDNIAEGIKFTLFDYGNSELEGPANNYNLSTKNDSNGNPVSDHYNIIYNGINTDRNYNDDILFFAYGTPPPHGEATGNYLDDNGNQIPTYRPGTHDKNYYSGDYNIDSYQSGNRPIQKIVKNKLGDDGYPVMNNNAAHSLDYLFKPNYLDAADYKTTYTDVNHFLKEVTQNGVRHLVYDSNENYAYFDTDSHNFTIYNGTYHIINDDHHRKNDENLIKDNPVTYPSDNGYEMGIGFFPFNEYDTRKRDPNWDGNRFYQANAETYGSGFNHHFGMTMETRFVNTPTNNQPIVFRYSGDDDMWVFVDGVLVLDIGGIHEPAEGLIDFTNGYVWVQDNAPENTESKSKAELIDTYQDFESFDSSILPKGWNEAGNKWIVKPISDFFNAAEETWNSGNGALHDIKMFYLERGGCYSNLAIDMNLPTLKSLTVTKEVDYQDHLVKGLYEDYRYRFQVWEKVRIGDTDQYEWVQPSDFDNNGEFTLKEGERKTFEHLDQNRVFKVVEVGVVPSENASAIPLDPNTFSEVTIKTVKNPNPAAGSTPIINGSVSSTEEALSEVQSYTFNNQIKKETTDISIKKTWDPPLADNDPLNNFTLKYKILRTDTVNGEVKQVALWVPDPNDPTKEIKSRNFSLTPTEWSNGKTITGLLEQYGNHYYTYRIEEINVPAGYKASYSVDDNNNFVIKNTNLSKTDIYVEKKWENCTDAGMKVKVRLTRSMIGYTESTKTSLTVNILDEGGNHIKTYDTNGVYAGGSAELTYTLPEGVEIYHGDIEYPQKQIGSGTPIPISNQNGLDDQLFVKFEEDEGILVVQNLADEANTVTFKVTSDNAKDSLLLIHHSFTRSTNGWSVQNDAQKQNNNLAEICTSSGVVPYAKGDALLIQNRTKYFNGAMLHLDPAKFKANKTYTFSTYIYSPVADQFKLTFNNGLGDYRPLKTENGGYYDIPAETWTQITGSLKISENIDPYNMYIIVESHPVTKNAGTENEDTEACLNSVFRMDEFTAIEGTVPVSVDQTSGIVRIGEVSSSGGQVYYHQFDGLDDGWTVRDYEGAQNSKTQTGAPDKDPNGHYIRVWNRDKTSDGIQKLDVSFLEAGKTYKFKVGAQHAGNDPAGVDKVRLTLYLNGSTVPDGNGGNTQYPWVCTVDITPKPKQDNPNEMDDYIWGENEGNAITIPAGANVSGMNMYFETDSAYNNPTGPFRIRYVEVTEVGNSSSTSALPDMPGYDESTGQYVSDYSNYAVNLETNSVTQPINIADTGYEPDNSFTAREVILKADNSWKYHWQNYDPTLSNYMPTEDANTLYKYHIEEISLIDSENHEYLISENSTTHDLMSSDGNYLVTYSGNDIANNTSNTPILVTNKYIWYTLPTTGGQGTTSIYILGSILTAIGLFSGSALYRRKRRRV